MAMFSVIFEVHPKQEKVDLYLDLAMRLRPVLEGIDGFVDNERFESSRRPGWILSHSTWRDEKSVVRWRTVAQHHDTQQRGRDEVFQDYHLRVGEIVADTAPPPGASIVEQRLDETEIGVAKFATLTEVQPGSSEVHIASAAALPDSLLLDRHASDLVDTISSPAFTIKESWPSWYHGEIDCRPNGSSRVCLPVSAPGIASCAWCATTACSIGAKVPNIIPRSRSRHLLVASLDAIDVAEGAPGANHFCNWRHRKCSIVFQSLRVSDQGLSGALNRPVPTRQA